MNPLVLTHRRHNIRGRRNQALGHMMDLGTDDRDPRSERPGFAAGEM